MTGGEVLILLGVMAFIGLIGAILYGRYVKYRG
jgi:hypothetical protein